MGRAHFFTPFCLPIWKLGIMHSVPEFSHFSQIGAPGTRLHLILLLRQFRQAACLLAMADIDSDFDSSECPLHSGVPREAWRWL